MLLTGRSVLVTGATHGIGRSTAALLARAGARVVAVGRDEEALAALTAEHPGVEPVVADLTDRGARATAVERAGRVDVLVNDAARGSTGLVEEMTAEEVRAIFELNVLAAIDLMQRVLPQMLDRRHGHIVNVGSITGYAVTPPLTAYASSKAALQAFTEGLRREVAGRGVRVSIVNPGTVDTRFLGRSSEEELGTRVPAQVVGIPPVLVAAAVLRSIVLGAVPGYQTIAVPRAAGLTRLAAVPGVSNLVDVASALSAPLLRRGRTSP